MSIMNVHMITHNASLIPQIAGSVKAKTSERLMSLDTCVGHEAENRNPLSVLVGVNQQVSDSRICLQRHARTDTCGKSLPKDYLQCV